MHGNIARAAAAYRETSVQSSSPLELVVLLYDGALRHITAAREAFDRGDITARASAISSALAIVGELQSTLNIEEGGRIASSLDELYSYVTNKLVDATVKKDPAALDEATRLLGPLRDAWTQIASGRAAPEPPR